ERSWRNLQIACVGCLSDKGWDAIGAVPRWAHTDAGDGMKKFATELRGKTVMTNDGQILGTIENFIVNTKSGKLSDVLVAPAENTPTKGLKTDPEGRIVLPFQGMRAVKDVVVMNLWSRRRSCSRAPRTAAQLLEGRLQLLRILEQRFDDCLREGGRRPDLDHEVRVLPDGPLDGPDSPPPHFAMSFSLPACSERSIHVKAF